MTGSPSTAAHAVVVTGGAGFVGSHVCDALLAVGHRVVALDDLSTGRLQNLVGARSHGDAFTFVEMGIQSPDLEGLLAELRPEVVMHLAAQAAVRPSAEDPLNDASINVLGTLNVLEASVVAGVRKIVYAASGGTLYGEPEALPVTEIQAPPAVPTSPYGISKKVADHYLRYYRATHELDFTQLALANVYGPRQDPLGEAGVIAIFGRLMLEGSQPVIFGDGEQTRDFVYATDVARAFVLAMEAASGELVNIGTGVGTSVLEIYRLLAHTTGYSGDPAHDVARPEELRRISLDVRLAAEALGWYPEVTLADGLDRTVEYLRTE